MPNTHKDILLLSTPKYRRKFRDSRQQPPLGFAYIGAYLKRRGIECSVLDGYSFDLSIDKIIDHVINVDPKIIGITTVSEDRFNAIDMANRIKSEKPGIVIVAGGPHFGHTAIDTLMQVPGVDFVVTGEGEQTLYELTEAVCGDVDIRNLHDIHGLTFRNSDGEIVKNERRKGRIDVNDISPDWGLFDMDAYQGGLCLENKTRAIGIVSSRGCPNNCVFCANALNRNVNYKDPFRFVDECEELIKKYKFDGINIQDDSFTSNREHVVAVCNEILRRNLRFRWYCSLRINETDEDILSLMKESGCIGIGFGVESGSDEVLRKVNKRIDTAMIFQAVERAVNFGYQHIGMFVMTSLPGENERTFLESQDFLNKLYGLVYKDWIRQPVLGSITQIYPGTAIEKMAIRRKLLPETFSWNKSYYNPKSEIFGTNPYLPYFENPDFPIEAIYTAVKKYFPSSQIYIC